MMKKWLSMLCALILLITIALPAAAQEDVEMGLGFDTPEEMEMWLESVES